MEKNINIPWVEKYRPRNFSDIVLDPFNKILLENIVKTLPDELGKLVNLGYLILPNNKQLRSLPSSVENLKDLTFLNIYNWIG